MAKKAAVRRNRQDATLVNVRASRRREAGLVARVRALEDRVAQIELWGSAGQGRLRPWRREE